MSKQAGLVVFSHGKDSAPASFKIEKLRPVAQACGWDTEAIDYSDTNDAQARKDRLVACIAAQQRPLVLWGSSLGGVVSVFAAKEVTVAGLFLLAPAVYWQGYEHLDYSVNATEIEIVHGWRDDVVPAEGSIRFAREHAASLHLLDDDHLLHESMAEIEPLFRHFLTRVSAQVKA